MKRIFLILLLCLPLVLSNDAIFKVGEQADLKVPCLNNNTYCSGSAICNVTIVLPDGSLFVEDAAMTNAGSYFNYTLNDSNTSVVGVYRLQVTCFDGVDAGYSLLDFKITNSGSEGLVADALVPALILISLLVFCAFMAWKLDDSEYGLRILFIGFALFLLLLLVRFAYLASNDDLVSLSNLLNTAYYVLLPVVAFIIFYFVGVKFIFEKVLLSFVKNHNDRRMGKNNE